MLIAGLEIPAGMLVVARDAYGTPPRAYHHFGHVQDVLQHHANVADGPGWAQPRETALAVLYHDAIYIAGRGDNEQRSAQLARAELARWLPDSDIDASRVATLIELTAQHGTLGRADFTGAALVEDTLHFLDCDMAILGAAPDAFVRYHQAIADEYRGVVPAWLYRRKRRAFLRGLLARPRIFLSDFFHERLDHQARENLARALEATP
jgi:predicted metal-dependent HD superfamily phosphohydrolase